MTQDGGEQAVLRPVTVHPMADEDFALVNAWRALPQLSAFAEETQRGGEIIKVEDEAVGWIEAQPAYAPAWQALLGPSVGDHPWTLDLFVVPARWNEGIGRAAIRLVSERCLAGKATCMVVDVESDNLASCRAFVGAGWEIIPTDEDAVILRYS